MRFIREAFVGSSTSFFCEPVCLCCPDMWTCWLQRWGGSVWLRWEWNEEVRWWDYLAETTELQGFHPPFTIQNNGILHQFFDDRDRSDDGGY